MGQQQIFSLYAILIAYCNINQIKKRTEINNCCGWNLGLGLSVVLSRTVVNYFLTATAFLDHSQVVR